MKVAGARVRRALDGVTVKDGEKIDEFSPVTLKRAAVGAEGLSFCSEGDFLEFVGAIPVEVEVAVKAADGLGCAKAPIEPNSGEHDFREGAFDKFTGEELFGNLRVGVAKFQSVKSGAFWRWGGCGGVFLALFSSWSFYWVICFDPLLIVGVEFFDGEGEDAPSFT